MAINAIADLQDGVQAQGATYLLAQRHRKTPSMLRVTSFRWQNDALFCYGCSYVLIVIVTFAHVTSIDHYTPCWGFGGFFSQFSYMPCSASPKAKPFPKFALAAVTRIKPARLNQSLSLSKALKLPKRHSRSDASLAVFRQDKQSVSRLSQSLTRR